MQPDMVLALCWQQPQQGCPGCIELSLGHTETGCSSCTLQMLTQAEASQLWVQAQGNLWTPKQTCLLLQQSQPKQMLLPPFPWLSCSMPLLHPQLKSSRALWGLCISLRTAAAWAGAAGAQTLGASSWHCRLSQCWRPQVLLSKFNLCLPQSPACAGASSKAATVNSLRRAVAQCRFWPIRGR